MKEPTEWKRWGMYEVSRDGYMRVAIYVVHGNPIGTYLLPRLVGSKYPRYRLTRKYIQYTHKISDILKKVWRIKKDISLEDAEIIKANAIKWNDEQQKARIETQTIRRDRLPSPKGQPQTVKYDSDDDLDFSDPFLCPGHPQQDPFSNWR